MILEDLFMTLTMYWYPNCSTCKKAKKWLEDHDLAFELIHIVEDTPKEATIKSLIEKSELEPKKFFNTSGKVYREDRKSTRLNSSHVAISYAVFCLKKK